MMSIMLIASATMGVEAQQLKSGIDVTNLNQTVKPGDDFYQYACGGWMKKNPLPAAYSRFGSFDQLQEDNNKRINKILKDLTTGKKNRRMAPWSRNWATSTSSPWTRSVVTARALLLCSPC